VIEALKSIGVGLFAIGALVLVVAGAATLVRYAPEVLAIGAVLWAAWGVGGTIRYW
jgi:hypothetical protein